MDTAPCTNCQKRYPVCHADCEDYKAWRKEHDERKRKRAEAKNKENTYFEYTTETRKRLRRYRNGN